MKQLIIIVSVAVLTAITVAGCKTTAKSTSSQDVPFTIADHYFVRNDVKTLPQGIITTQEEFQRNFGEATVMGGLPTKIDFSKEFVIATCVPETDYNTEISPVALKMKGKNLLFTYRVNKGKKIGYSIQPMLLIVVDKEFEAPLKMEQR